ncbi:VWA domain-containing protein [Methanococcoides sp.]|uniref:VWA domain-containing protein n=1 Tax=Methanococcoides sp. TaxID=1966350 RepID=UPI00272DED80|nr:VWA domain-containing protein [Methanococcoides sp.]
MKDQVTASRLRKSLDRNYDVGVFNPGRPVISVRLPLTELSQISGTDTEAVHKKLISGTGSIQPEDVKEIFIIADNDHVIVDPKDFFKSFKKESEVETVFEEEQEFPKKDDYDIMRITIPENGVEQGSKETVDKAIDEVEVHLVPREYEPKFETGPKRIKKEKPVLVKRNKQNLVVDIPGAKEDIPEIIPEEKQTLELLETKVPEAEGEVCNDPKIEEPGPISENRKDTAEFESEQNCAPEDISKSKTKPERDDHLEDEKAVSKILTDFAKNKQKKKVVSGRLKSGRRAEVLTKGKRGRYVRYKMPGDKVTDIAIAPTVRAAAHHAKDGKISIKKSDIREKIRRRRISTLINIVFDTSDSMDEKEKIKITTDVVLALLKDAYQRRDRVSLVTYSGRSAELVLPFTSSVESAKRYLEKVPFGGTTPMVSGILTGVETILQELKREPSAVPIMILVTDGTANVPLNRGGSIERELLQVCKGFNDYRINMLVVDISRNGSDLAEKLADVACGKYYHPVLLSKETLYSAIKGERNDLTDIASSASNLR